MGRRRFHVPSYDMTPSGKEKPMSIDDKVAYGPDGQVASNTLMTHRKRLDPKAIELRPDLYCVVGLNICNTQLIVTTKGIVVVDTGRSSADGEAILQMASTVSTLPVIAVIYSHSHYTFGTGPILQRYPGIPVIAHSKVHSNTLSWLTGARRFTRRRGRMESGFFLPKSGPDADAIGSRISTPGFMSYIRPTVEIAEDGETMEIGGVPMEFYISHSFDTDDTMIVWLPEQRAILHNHFADNFPNLYPIQGGKYRDPTTWLTGIDLMRALKPEHLLSTHGAPTAGESACAERLTVVRDALQFVLDQTVRGMNHHLLPEEIVASISLPTGLAESEYIKQTYGMLDNHVRGVYSGLAGWFDGDAASIYQPSPSELARLLIRDLGGTESAIEKMKSAIERHEYRWAANLGRHLYSVCPEDERVKEQYATVLRFFGQHSTAWTVRNYYISQALLVEGATKSEEPDTTIDPQLALDLEPGLMIELLRYRVNPARVSEKESRLFVRFSDSNFEATLVLRNGIAEYVVGETFDSSRGDTRVSCERRRWIGFADSLSDLSKIAADPDVTCEPSREAARKSLSVFDD